MNDLERFDLDSDIGDLDLDSAQRLLDLTDLWSQRRRLRQRWTLRKQLSEPRPFLLTRRI